MLTFSILDIELHYICLLNFFNRNFPNIYYPLSAQTPDGAVIDIFMIDTIKICGNSDDFSSKAPGGPEDKNDAEDQWEWLEGQMAGSKYV